MPSWIRDLSSRHRLIVSACAFGMAILAASAIAPSLLTAQSIRGRVVLADSVTPAMGVVVSAINERGAEVSRALSATTGEYIVRVASPGRYQLRALRIGFRPTVIDGIEVSTGQVRVQQIVMNELPVTIAAVSVRDPSACNSRGAESETIVQLWTQARAALAATQLSDQRGSLDVQIVRSRGRMDAIAYHATRGGGSPGEPHPETDTMSVDEVVGTGAFASTPSAVLESSGYVRRDAQDRVVFDAPSPDILLTDNFAAQHCFRLVESPDDHRDWIGIGFRPQKVRDSLVDIRGTIWMDRTSAELRRIEFDYTNLPEVELRLCDAMPPIEAAPLGARAIGPHCNTFNNQSNRLGIGGSFDLHRLATGEWLAVRWTMRLAPDEAKLRKRGVKTRYVNRQFERCYYGKDCREVFWSWPRLITNSGTVSRVIRAGETIYRNDSSASLIAAAAAKRAGSRPAHFEGIITGTDMRPLMSAIVQTREPGRVAITDSAGAFRLRTLPVAPLDITVRCRGYQPRRFSVPLSADSTRRVSLQLAADSTNTSAAVDCSGRR